MVWAHRRSGGECNQSLAQASLYSDRTTYAETRRGHTCRGNLHDSRPISGIVGPYEEWTRGSTSGFYLRAPKDHIKTRMLPTMVSGSPLVLGLGLT